VPLLLSSCHIIYLFSNREKREIAAGAGNGEGKRGDQRKFLSYASWVGEPKDNPSRRRQPPVVVIKKRESERERETNGYMYTHKGPTLLIARLL